MNSNEEKKLKNNKKTNATFKAMKKGKKKEYKYHLIPGDFEKFNFEKLLYENESKEYEGILWNNSRMCDNGKVDIDLTVKKGDIVYIYYTNLPDRINKILLRCSVLDTSSENSEDCFYYKDAKEKEEIEKGQKPKIPAMRLKVENALRPNDKNIFTKENLSNEYGINKIQGKMHLREDLLKKLSEDDEGDYYQRKLIEKLEKTCKRNKEYGLEQLKDDINKMSKCTLEDCKALKSANHSTFQKENGMNYYEAHHLIEQCNGRKNEKFPKDIISDSRNIINLCPNCHKRIHNGKKEDRKLMVTYLYKLHEEEYNNLLHEIKEVKNGENPLHWLLKQYDVND